MALDFERAKTVGDKTIKLVSGYLNELNQSFHQQYILPSLVINSCLLFYSPKYQILQFSEKYSTPNGWELTNDNKCAMSIKPGWAGKKYILTTCNPVTEGTHCWRIQVNHHHFLYNKIINIQYFT